eukprot:1539704-Rhodomonas_salina.1
MAYISVEYDCPIIGAEESKEESFSSCCGECGAKSVSKGGFTTISNGGVQMRHRPLVGYGVPKGS